MDLGGVTNMVKGLPPWLLLGTGAALGWLKSFWSFFYDHTIGWLSNKCKVELVIEERDHVEAFVWINLWMEKKLREKRISKLRLQKKTDRTDKETEEKAFELLPSYGFYWLWWKYKLLTFYSEKKDAGGGDGYGTASQKLIRTITLELWGTRDRALMLDIINEAKAEFDKRSPDNVKFYTHAADYWESYSMDRRELDSVYLPDEQLQNILQDFETFYKSKDKYKNLGIPWRRTLLFEGPPGSGKSTLVQALSSHYNVPVYYMNLNKLSENGARELLYSVATPCIILMEDIDSVNAAKVRVKKDVSTKGKAGEDNEDSKLGLKPSELLNLLDGIIATEKRIIIMTTNHPETLDAAMLRPGRVDRRFHVGYAEDAELQKFYGRAKQYYDLPEYKEFRKQLPKNCTIADAQGLMFKLNSDLTPDLKCDKV